MASTKGTGIAASIATWIALGVVQSSGVGAEPVRYDLALGAGLLVVAACGGSTPGSHGSDGVSSGSGGGAADVNATRGTSGQTDHNPVGVGINAVGTGGKAAAGSGGSVAAGDGGATIAGDGGLDASVSSADGGSVLAASCPASPPTEASMCAQDLSCTWGDHPAFGCRTHGFCQMTGTGFSWHVSVPAPDCSQPLLPPECPAQPGSGKCDQDLNCFYTDRTACTCGVCSNVPGGLQCGSEAQGSHVWSCQPPSMVPSCNPLPNEGRGCELPSSTHCFVDCSKDLVCRNGIWRLEGQSGPTRCSPGVCADPDTAIATPLGERRIADLVPGDLVYSVDHDAVAVVALARISRTPVVHHSVMRIELANGRSFSISAGHPTADGRTLGDLVAGAVVDNQIVQSASVVAYEHPYTYDILPASNTGTYFAAGLLVGSTLFARLPESPASVP
jgi:hypothetical protein